MLPSYGRAHNPLDLVGDANAEMYKRVLDAVRNDKNIDMILCITLFQTVSLEPSVVDVLAEFKKKYDKPLVVCTTGGHYVHKRVHALEHHAIPVFETPDLAARALKQLYTYSLVKKHAPTRKAKNTTAR